MLMRRAVFGLVCLTLLVTGCGRNSRVQQGHSRHDSTRTAAQRVSVQPVPLRDGVTYAEKPSPDAAEAAQPKLKWPRPVLGKALSPDGKSLALWDAKGIYLTKPPGKRPVRLRIQREPGIANESFNVTFRYNRQSTRLAVLTQLSGGEPIGFENVRLYWVDVRRPKTHKMADWAERIQGNGVAIVGRELVGWSVDGNSIRMQADAWEGEGMPGAESVKNESTRSVSFDVTRPRTWNSDALASHLSW